MQSESGFCLSVSGDATIRATGDVHRRLSDALRDHGEVLLEASELTEVDLTFVQVVESARRTAKAAGKRFGLSAPASGGLLEVLQRGGFLQPPSGQGFWLCEQGGA
jgi:hypothetical protein